MHGSSQRFHQSSISWSRQRRLVRMFGSHPADPNSEAWYGCVVPIQLIQNREVWCVCAWFLSIWSKPRGLVRMRGFPSSWSKPRGLVRMCGSHPADPTARPGADTWFPSSWSKSRGLVRMRMVPNQLIQTQLRPGADAWFPSSWSKTARPGADAWFPSSWSKTARPGADAWASQIFYQFLSPNIIAPSGWRQSKGEGETLSACGKRDRDIMKERLKGRHKDGDG